jgi:shikimate dehydrogenase
MLGSSARWVKIVPTASSLHDLIVTLGLHRRFNGRHRRHRRLITFAMGSCGLASRYLAPILGPPLGFAAWSEGAAAAPGQLTISRTDAVIGHLLGPPKRLYGVVGADVSSSLSPPLHAAAARALGLPYLMVPISVPDPRELSDIFRPEGETCFDQIGLPARGWAVTTPYKQEAAAAADLQAPRVRRAGAANTLILRPGQLVAENTDADGVVGSLTSLGVDPAGRTAVVCGAGGAARGAAVGLHLAGAEVFLRGRSDEKTAELAAELGVGWTAAGAVVAGEAILVNATPLGREASDSRPFVDEEVASSGAVVDMVYGDQETDLVRRARQLDIPVADGRDVLLHQGIAQFAAFAQTVPPRDAMREAIQPGDGR